MKIDYISDIHKDSWKHAFHKIKDEDFFEPSGESDICVFAGDAGNGAFHYFTTIEALKRRYETVIPVAGNHDFYYHPYGIMKPENNRASNNVVKFKGLKFVMSTLWTNFRDDPNHEMMAMRCISDFEAIQGMTTARMKDLFDESLAWLKKHGDADVFVTHFGPFIESEHRAYDDSSELNPYFINDLSEFYEKLNKKPKLWIHGHTHKKIDYMHGETRVVANPIGYLNEEQRSPKFKAMVVEINR